MTKDPRDKRGNSVESRDEAEVCRPQWTWAPRLDLEGAAIPYDALIWDAPRGHANHLAQALQQPLLQGHGFYSTHKTARPVHVPKEGFNYG